MYQLKKEYQGWPVTKLAKYSLLKRGYTPKEILGFPLPTHLCGECGRFVFSTPDDVAIFCGGVGAVDRQELDVDGYSYYEQYSIHWGDGWRGGISGGIRTACDEMGYENF